ncbi:MAG: adenylate/guanylate cyclase domain-containing protein [Spirochaetota bacterium]|nr:adenylate/guanylate cyclase domain-containing protein [Spirochaetota bacterium]
MGLNVSEHGAHTALLDLANEVKKVIFEQSHLNTIRLNAEEATEAGEIASHINTMLSLIDSKHLKEKNILIREKESLDNAFNKFINEQIKQEIINSNLQLGGKQVKATILFSDIRNFTALANGIGAEKTVEFLNNYFGTMASIISKNGGILDKFIGDAIMAIFGPPQQYINHADRAVESAIQMIESLKDFNDFIKTMGIPPVQHGIGINTGIVIEGIIGSDTKMEYTVVGDPVNIAARIESLTKKLHVNLIISENTYNELSQHIKQHFIQYGKVKFKGIEKPIIVFVRGIK